MKKTCIFNKATWLLILSGSIVLGSCNNNKTTSTTGSPTADVNDTPPGSIPSYVNQNNGLWQNGNMIQDNGIDYGTANAATDNNSSNNTTQSLAANNTVSPTVTTASSVTTWQHRKTNYSALYNRYRRHSKTVDMEGNVAAIASTPPAPQNEDLVTVDKPNQSALIGTETTTPVAESPAYEQQTEYFGNNPTTKTTKTKRVHIGPEVGGNVNYLFPQTNSNQTSSKPMVGFNAGARMDIGISDHWAVQPALMYIMKGGEVNSQSATGGELVQRKDDYTFHYVELPVDVVYKTRDRKHGHFMVGAGPYFSYLAGTQDKYNMTITTADGSFTNSGNRSLKTAGNTKRGDVSNTDMGVNAFVGYQMPKGVYIKAGAEGGLMDLQRNSFDAGNLYDHNYNFLLSVGYMPGAKK